MNLLNTIANYASYRRTVRELSRLDNARLRDLGISRHDIKAVARAAAY